MCVCVRVCVCVCDIKKKKNVYSLPFGYISICVCAYMSIYISIHGTTDWFKLGKEYNKAVYCHPAYLTCMQSTSCEMIDWMNQKLESSRLEKHQQ